MYILISTQTGDDNLNSECQTEPLEKETCWTQYPSIDTLGWGREVAKKAHFNFNDTEDSIKPSSVVYSSTQAIRLTKFADVAGQVCFLQRLLY